MSCAAALHAAIVHDRRACGLWVYLWLPVETFITPLGRILRWNGPPEFRLPVRIARRQAGHGDRVRFGHGAMPDSFRHPAVGGLFLIACCPLVIASKLVAVVSVTFLFE